MTRNTSDTSDTISGGSDGDGGVDGSGARQLDAEDIRLIEAAGSVFAARGIKGTSTDDIAKAAGVTRVTLYRRLGTRNQIMREIYAHEAQRLMKLVTARFTPFESLKWDPVRHVEDLLVGTIFDIRDSKLLKRLVELDRVEAMSVLASQSDSVLGAITEIVADFLRSTWNADVHTRPMTPDELESLSYEVGSVVGRFLHSIVVMPDGPPATETEKEIRGLARRVLVPMILQR